MEAIAMDKLILDSMFNVTGILDLEIEHKVNEHGRMTVRGYLGNSPEPAERLSSEGSEIKLMYMDEEGLTEQIPLFAGLIQKVHIFQEGGVRQVILSAVSGSYLLDQEKRSCSFQDISMSYKDVVKQVLQKAGGSAICSIGKETQIGKPLIQYEETDWEFIKRLSSHFHSYILPDLSGSCPHLWFGMRQGSRTVHLSNVEKNTGMDKRYYRTGKETGLSKSAFLYYEVKDIQNYQVGDQVEGFGTGYQICEKRAELSGGILRFVYRIGRPEGMCTPVSYNEQFDGLSLGGSVVKTDRETVCIHLDIDEEGSRDVYPYHWTPLTGNIMYCMPEPGTRVNLYFGNHDERSGQAVCSPGSNGSTCADMADPGRRTLTTAHGKRLNLFPDELSILGSSDGVKPSGILMSDGNGMVIQSHNGIEIVSGQSVCLEAPNVAFHTPQEVNVYRTSVHVNAKQNLLQPKGTGKKNPPTGGDSSFIMNYEFHTLGDGGILCGTDFVEYEPFPDAPEQVPVEEESGFAGLWGNILAGLAVVAAVSLAAAYLASLVFTAGASATIAPMVVGGLAAAVGAAAVLGTAAKDAENGTNSGAASYIMNGLTGALTGALAGFELCLAPYAAETVIAASAPFGMSIFGQFVSAGALVDLTASGFFAITGANTLFKLTNAIEQVSGVNWMKSMGMSDESYSSYEEFSDLMSLQIGFWGMMNPRLWEKPKDPPGKITQSAGYQNPAVDSNIEKKINKALKSQKAGTKLEGEVAQALGNRVTDFQKKIVTSEGLLGEIDVETADYIIEVTSGRSSKTASEFGKYFGTQMNPDGKGVILFAPNLNETKVESIEEAGVVIIRSIKELLEYLGR